MLVSFKFEVVMKYAEEGHNRKYVEEEPKIILYELRELMNY